MSRLICVRPPSCSRGNSFSLTHIIRCGSSSAACRSLSASMLHPMLAFFASISCSTTSRPPFLALFFLRPLPTSALLSVPLSFPASVRAHVALLVRGLVAALLSPPPRSLLHHLPPPPTRARTHIHLTTCPRSLLPSPPSPLHTHLSRFPPRAPPPHSCVCCVFVVLH